MDIKTLLLTASLWVNTNTPYHVEPDKVVVETRTPMEMCEMALPSQLREFYCFTERYVIYGLAKNGHIYMNSDLEIGTPVHTTTFVHELIHLGQDNKRGRVSVNYEREELQLERVCRELDAIHWEYLFAREEFGYDPDAPVYETFEKHTYTSMKVYLTYMSICPLSMVKERLHND